MQREPFADCGEALAALALQIAASLLSLFGIVIIMCSMLHDWEHRSHFGYLWTGVFGFVAFALFLAGFTDALRVNVGEGWGGTSSFSRGACSS